MEGKIDIKALIHKLTSKWHYFLFALLFVVPLAYVYIEFAKRVYHVRASMLLNGETKNGIPAEKFLKGMELFTPHTEIEDEIGLLKSYDLVKTAINKLDFGISYFERKNFKSHELYGNSAFTIELDSTVDQVVNVPIFIERTSDNTYSVHATGKKAGTYNFHTGRPGEAPRPIEIHAVHFTDKPFEHENLKFSVRFHGEFMPDDQNHFYFIIQDLTSVAEAYQEKLDVKPITRESNIVELNIKGAVPKKEILFLNTLMDVYLMHELQKRNQLGLKTIEFINEQLSGVSEELHQVESSLESFRLHNNIRDIDATAENLTTNLDRLEIDKMALESKLKYYESISRALDKGGDLKDVPLPSTFGLEDPVLNDLILQLSKLNQERIGLNYIATEGNPAMEMLDLKIANHRKELIENVTNFLDASAVALNDLNNRIHKIKSVVKGLPVSERELVNIQRRYEFNDNVYNYLLEKRAEAGIAIASNTVEKSIVDRAKQIGRAPVSPNKKLILLLALIAGLVLAVGMIILKDVVSDSIVTMQDVESSTMIPFIGAIGHGTRRDRAAAIVAHRQSELGESFRSLRVNLQYLTLGNEDNVIGITSSITNEGKTFCSVNLAAALAMSGRRTVLIDADLRRPRIASIFNLKKEKGLSNFLDGSCETGEIIFETPVSELDVIPSGPIPGNPLDLVGDSRMGELIQELKQSYNTIVIDSPPIGHVSEYIILMKHTNANIYVVRSNYTSRNHLEKINRLYKDKKIRNVSILLNDAKPAIHGYKYAYN